MPSRHGRARPGNRGEEQAPTTRGAPVTQQPRARYDRHTASTRRRRHQDKKLRQDAGARRTARRQDADQQAAARRGEHQKNRANERRADTRATIEDNCKTSTSRRQHGGTGDTTHSDHGRRQDADQQTAARCNPRGQERANSAPTTTASAAPTRPPRSRR